MFNTTLARARAPGGALTFVRPASLAWVLVLLAACSDDTFVGPDSGIVDGPVVAADGEVPGKDGPPVKPDGPAKRPDGPAKKPDGPAVKPDTKPWPADQGPPAPDKGPGPSKLPPPPPGAVLLRFSVDDSADKTYAGGELMLKGQFKYDSKTNVITHDSAWTGPFVPLWDDGASGLEGPGSVAGDHKLGALVYFVPKGTQTIEYGAISPAGWMWPESGNQKVIVSPGDPQKTLPGYKVPPRAGVDVQFEVDNKYLSGTSVQPGYETVTVRGTFTHWAPLLCEDKGKDGDAKAGDLKYTGRLSAQIGKGRRFPHIGLLQPGQKVRFYLKVGSNTYTKPNGIVVRLTHAAGSQTVPVSQSGSNLTFTVPAGLSTKAAPAPETGPLPGGKQGNPKAGLFNLPSSLKIAGHYYVPEVYDAHRPMPLLVALHGAYEQGQWMVGVWQTLAEEWGFILLAPSSKGKSWDLTAVFYPSAGNPVDEEQPILDAVAWLRGQYNVKAGQIGVEGFSDGASMTLYMATTHRSLFCVGMPNSPGGMGSNYSKPGSPKPAIYMTHGDADKVLPVTGARSMAKNLQAAGYKVTYIEFPGGAHVFPTDNKLPMLDYFTANAR